MPFRAPELFDPPRGGRASSLDCRTDVWALGCLLFAWWHGYSPFECMFVESAASSKSGSSCSVIVTECSHSRVLSRPPRKKKGSSDDDIISDLSEWMLEKDFTVRPHCSDVLTRVQHVLATLKSGSMV